LDPYQTTPSIHPNLPPLRLVNHRTQEHVGPCPFCGGDSYRSDRFHVWLEPNHERFWCRACGEKGALRTLIGADRPLPRPALRRPRAQRQAAAPIPENAGAYRALYTAVALWSHSNLLDPANPEPLAYLRQRGLNDTTVARAVLGVTRRDPAVLADLLRREHPELLPYAEAAGVLTRDHAGALRAHANLCGCLVFPYIAGGEIVDLRTRTYPGKGYRSLAGGYSERGATSPFGWDELGDTETVLITEGEIKALMTTQAYQDGRLSIPALAHPGLSYLREEWGPALRQRGVRTVILAYDSQRRAAKDGAIQLTPEELWTIRQGRRLVAAGLEVRVLRLTLEPAATKSDVDAFLIAHGPARLQHLIDTAPSLSDYHRSLPRHMLKQAKLPLAGSDYPLRRARPLRLDTPAAPQPSPAATITRDDARAQIITLVRDHAMRGSGMLVLAHPPGAGKGHNTVTGINAYLQAHATPGQIVWTALRKEQIHDQSGLELTLLHGRNTDNCHKFGEAQALTRRGYSVSQTLCERRCPFVDSCAYRRQFTRETDFFAPQPLLQATTWWQAAAVVVLDEFDPARLTRIVTLDSADLARMAQHADDPHAQTLLGWLATLLGSATDRTLPGGLLLAELEACAEADGLELGRTLQAACVALPAAEDVARLPGFPKAATIADYEALPVNYLSTIITQLITEHGRYRAGQHFTSRLELSGGRLWLYLRAEHLIAQLARPEQPKLILDATVNAALLQAIFPTTPIQIERPRIAGGARVTQVITRDWAKSTLRGARRDQWHDAVARTIRPGHPTLVVCTKACEAELRAALGTRGHSDVAVAHYGALRGSNAYKGFDIILSQMYNPNLEAIIREGRALFAGDAAPLDEALVTVERTLTDAKGARWVVQVPTFADYRLAALLEQRRESELVQAALRGRPFDHPEAQVTLLFGLPLPSLPPTEVRELGDAAPTSNTARTATAREALAGAAQQLLDSGQRVVSVDDLAAATGQSVVTVRRHMAAVAGRLGLRLILQRRMLALPNGGMRRYERAVLTRRGRWVPPKETRTAERSEPAPTGKDHARNESCITRVILPSPRRRRRAAPLGRTRWGRARRARRRRPPRLRS